MNTINYLLEHSHLPGPRGNLTLLYSFARNARQAEVEQCLTYLTPEVKNSPEEFVAMCGILGFSLLNKANLKKVLTFLKKHSTHASWRIREAVAISIQEIAAAQLDKVLIATDSMIKGNAWEKRAVVAGFCEPKLLHNETSNLKIMDMLLETSGSLNHDQKLFPAEKSLRKALGYGWSVIIAASPEKGKAYFQTMFDWQGKHIQWIIKENLKKKRLVKMDSSWVEQCLRNYVH